VIRIYLGNLGSGKSLHAVHDMMNDLSGRKTYTNLDTFKIPNAVHIKPEHVISKIPDGKKIMFDLNLDYWNRQEKPLNLLWDEIHLTANSRGSMSKINIVFSRFISMARRITGFDHRGYGSFTFIAQKERTMDINIKDMASEIVYHIGHWIMKCEDCGARIQCSSEKPPYQRCIKCGSWNISKDHLLIEMNWFKNFDHYYAWCVGIKGKWMYKRQLITDPEKYFKHYDTVQVTDVWNKYVSVPIIVK